MVSDFLKKKAAEYTNKQKEDGPAPSSPKDSKYENTRASSFLQEKAKTQAAYITDKFGDDAVGSTKWLMQDSALSDESLSGLLNRIKTLPGIGPGADTRRTSGGYYSLPEYDDGMEDLRKQIEYLSPAMREYGIPLETATSDLKQVEKNLQITQSYLQKAMDAYKSDPTDANAQVYNQIYAAYEKANAAYASCYDAYNTEFQKYKTTADQVAAIQEAYRKYTGQRQADYDAWRGTIRDATSVKQEIDVIDAQISELKKGDSISRFNALMGNMADLMARSSSGLAPTTMMTGTDSSEEIKRLEEMKALLQEELDWSQHYYYNNFSEAPNFAQMSKYATTANGLEPILNNFSGMYTETGFDDLTYDYINRNEEAKGKAMVNAIGDNTALLGMDKSYLEKMTDKEISVFNYLYATQGPDAAYEYTAYLTKDLNRRQREKMDAYWTKYAEEKPIESSLFSVLTSPLKGLSYLGQAADLAGTGKIDENAGYNKFAHVPNAIRGTVAETIEKSGKWGEVGSFAYQTGLSMADFLFATAVSGGNSGLAMTIMGTGAAADTTLAAKERGVDDEKAMCLGAVAGLAEALTEKVSIETLLDPKLLMDGTWKYIVKNAITEGAEEGASDLINLLADILIAGDQSEWRQSIQAHMAEGMTEQEAFRKTLTDQMLTVGLDMLGGAISGGVMSGGNAVVQNRYNSRITKAYDLKNATAEDARTIIESGLESDPETESHQLAEQLQKKLDNGTIPTADELARLTWANEQAIQAEEADGMPDGLRLRAMDKTEDFRQQEDAPEQNVNGGTEYESNRIYAGPADAQGGRTDVLHGSSQRYDGTGTGEQTGSLASSPEQRRSAYADRSRATVARQNYARSLRLEKVSSLDLGLQNGTEARNIQVMPQENWDVEMSQLADRIYNETGKGVTYVMGRIQIRGTGGTVGYARGVITGDRIIVQADHLRIPMEQIADHEAYHAKVDFTDGRLNDEIRRHIVETFSEEQFRQVLDKYIVGLRGVIDVNETHTGAEFEAAVRQIEEEIFADAYAGINAFGAGADQFTGAVNEKMDQLYMGKIRNQDNGTEEPTGPPADRFSYEDQQRLSLPTLDDEAASGYEGRSLISDPEIYTYRFMTAQPPMKLVELPPVTDIRDAQGKIDTAKVVRNGIKNTLSVGSERDGRTYVKNRYTGRDLLVTTAAIRHGLNGAANRMLTNARMGSVIGKIVQNAIPINALHNTANGVEGTYAMAGYTFDQRGREFIAIITVEQRTNAVEDIAVYDMTHAISGRQKRSSRQEPTASIGGSQADTKSQGFNLIKASSEISIADLLEAVKEVYQSILSNDVLAHMGETRNPEGHYAGRVRYSYAGEKAKTADLEALERAKKMQAAGVAEETIRQQTGWHTGMDGKWRWEIDDSGMEYSGRGDLGLRERRPEYARYRELLDKANRHALELSDEALTPEEAAELQKLKNIWGGTFRKAGRITEDALPTELLSDYVKHDALFEAYPQLRKTRLRFADLPEGTRGQYDPEQDIITLSNKLRGKPQDTLIHEIQHVIQKAEGFAQGSSPEFWEQVQKGEQPVRANDRRIAEAERKIQEIMDSLPPFVAGQFELHRHLEKSDPDKAMELADHLSEGLYGDQFSDFFMLTWDLDMAAGEDNYIRGAGDLYRNTAGEIEARDAASRRQLTAEQRRSAAPARADDRTVFVEDVDDLNLRLGDRYSVDDVDSYGHSLTPEQQAYYAQSQARDRSGRLLVLYHQTDSDFTVFDTKHPGAGSRDGDTPFGIFMKQTAGDIGLAGKKQMALYANITNPLRAVNREDLARQLRKISGNYAAISDKHKRLDAEYHEKFEQAKKAWRDYVTEWRAANPGANRRDIYEDPEFNELYDAEDVVIDEWTAASDQLSIQAKEAITEDLRKAGYDGVFLENDVGSWGRRTDAIIALDPQQVKNISNKTPTSNPDIRYSVDDMSTEDYDALENEFVSRQRGEKERFLRERLGDDGYAQFKADRDSKARQKKEEAATRAKVARQVETNQRKLHLEAETQKIDREERRRLQNETAPVKAKKTLRNTVINLFSIPEGSRAELGTMIDNYAERIIKNGSLTEDDRKAFFDRMYASGVMTVPANDYFAEARSYLKEGRIYVPDSVVADFGDDWQDIRKRAFAAGIYLTRARNQNGHSVAGIDTWNGDLASAIPGLFDPEETDQRSILERIVQVAEEGKDEKLSLAEYTARLAEQEYVSEEEFLDNMERQMDWALRTFATSAGIEIETKEREIRKQTGTRRQNLKLQATLAAERQTRKDAAQKARDRKELQELQQRTLKQLQWLSQNRNRAPEELKETWDEVLGDIDLFSVSAANEMNWSQKHGATWKDLAQMYKDAQKNDPNFLPSKDLERIVTRLDATKIGEMDLGALQDLYKAAVGLRTEFYNRNNVINDEMQRLFAEVYTDAKKEIEAAPGGYTGKVMDKLLNLDQLTPMNVLQRMGGWDPNGAFYAMARQLEHGERDMRAYSVKAQKMLQEFLTEHEDWVKKADGQGKDGIWYEVEVPQLMELGMGDAPIFGPTVKVYMTPAQKVHMYLESKNFDNLRHMTGGRTFANKELYSQGKRQEALSQGTTIRMAPETVKALVADLTPEEMELARVLDQYYNQFATQEINRVSNILYGYDKAMGKNYAPIYTNRNYTKSEFGVFDATAEGVGNLKGRQYAVNPSYNISAFDAFERHKDQTARFVGMAIPARNWTTLMNWREKNNSTGDVITHKWGEESKRYIEDMITTLQAGDSAKTDTVSSGISKLQSNYISAIFGANPSIVLKQLGSIPMAGAYLDARNMPTPTQIAKIDREFISKYTKELEWRTMGYTTPETKQLKDNPNWTQSNKTFKFIFGGGAITAMDGWAASVLWPWAENKVRREYPELEMGTQEEINNGESPFYKKVAEEFEDAMNRSQSVSDEIHQGRLRKSKNPVTRAFTMFRSDSAQTYNALRQKIGEARYYMRTGAKDQMIRAAKKAVGTAFMAMLVNAAWSESISFLMALWKNKGKYYRDDEDELTAESVAGEMVSNMLGSFAGVVTGGEEIFELIGNIVTGDTWYGIETPGMEQLNDLIDVVVETGSDMRDLVADAWDVVKNGGDLGEYFGKNSGTILSCVKDLAEAAAMYLPGLPVSNLEAYLMGAVKWVSPELGAAYDDLFDDVGKSDLAGAEGEVLQNRIGRILDDRKISQSDATAQALADLYAAGFKTAVPGDTPTSVTIDGEKHSLGAYQQQAYDTIWGGVVADALDDLVASEQFVSADPETQAKMLDRLYDYAAEHAKAELFDKYELGNGAVNIDQLRDVGLALEECITWASKVSGMKQAEKIETLRQWDMTDKEKLAVMGTLIGTDMETESGKPSQYAKMLEALNQGMDMNQYLDMRLKGTDVEDYLDLIEEGMDADLAYDFSNYMEEMETAADGEDLDDLTKWRASVDFSNDVEDQLAALSMVMTDSQMIGVEVANNFGIVPDLYVKFFEVRSQYDADGNGSFKQAEVKAVIDGQFAHLSKNQKAALWQLMNSSTKSAKNNPYSQEIGQKVLDAKEAAKNATDEEEEPEGLKLGSW